MEQLSKEKLLEINEEIQAVLTKYGVALQPTLGISYVIVPKSEKVEAEVLSPLQADDLNNPTN